MIRELYYRLSPTNRLAIRKLYYLPVDLIDKLKRKDDDLVPPKGLIFTGSGDFRKQGETLLADIIAKTGLRPDSKILDIGCGIGRLAIPLTKYLNAEGQYSGFDIVDVGINWCKKNIEPRFPNFDFLHIDLKNDLYNLSTEEDAKDYKFHYADEIFDVVVLTSVFTHMQEAEVSNYLDEIKRVLKKGGKCYATFFIISDEIREEMKKNKKGFQFPYNYGNYSLLDRDVTNANIAFEQTFLEEQLIRANGLNLDSIHYGYWVKSRFEKTESFQDIVIISKPRN